VSTAEPVSVDERAEAPTDATTIVTVADSSQSLAPTVAVPSRPPRPPRLPRQSSEDLSQPSRFTRQQLLGSFEMVPWTRFATPKSESVWRQRQEQSGLGLYEFLAELRKHGLDMYKSSGKCFVRETPSRLLVRLC
jgi:hypothetical protein